MNTKKVLLSCNVISLQDTRFVYPCCKVCLCRVTEELNSRSRCPKCGFTCDKQNVDYRFRLALKVYRETRLFRVTVFGGCLNPFFGITAGGLHGFLESETFKGPQSLQQLLIKAVEDCFIGKCLVFGFKLSGRDEESCLLGEQVADESVQFVACQIIPPCGALIGVSVFAYLHSLMQVNALSDSPPDAVCQRQKKDSLVSSFEYTLPLCHYSHSTSGNDSLTLPSPWNLVADLDLCFFPEETRLCSVPEVSVNIKDSQDPYYSQWPNDRQSAKLCPFPLSESRHTAHNSLSTFHSSLFNASFISPIKINPSDQPSKCFHANQWTVKDCFSQIPTSFSENTFVNHTSFSLEDAPLSETLGDFVSTELSIVNQKAISSSTGERTPDKAEHNALLKNDTIPSDSPVLLPLHSSGPVLTPLRDVTNVKKSLERIHGKQTSMSGSKHAAKLSQVSVVSLFCNKKDLLSVGNGGMSKQNHVTKKQENWSNANEDAYNCSADLFSESNMNIVDAKERDRSSFSGAELRTQDQFADIKEPISLHFAPSLQSTPIVGPSTKCTYRQCEPSKKGPRKCLTRTSLIRALRNHAYCSQGLQLVKPSQASNSAFEIFESSAGSSEQKANWKHTNEESILPTVPNDCSRDLFDSI